MKTSAAPESRNLGDYLALIPAAGVLVGYSVGFSAIVRDAYHPAVPQWIIGGVIAAAIVGGIMGAAGFLRSAPGRPFAKILIGLLSCAAGAIVMIAFGGLYLLLGERFARRKEPVTTLILATGLGVTVFGFGIAISMEFGHMISVFVGAVVGLVLLKLAFKTSPMGFVRFGALHVLTFFVAMVVASIEDEKRQDERLESLPLSLNSTSAPRGMEK